MHLSEKNLISFFIKTEAPPATDLFPAIGVRALAPVSGKNVNSRSVVLKHSADQKMTLRRVSTIITRMVRPDTLTGNQTGAIHGFGIRKRTSVVFRSGGHLIRI